MLTRMFLFVYNQFLFQQKLKEERDYVKIIEKRWKFTYFNVPLNAMLQRSSLHCPKM